MRVKQDTPWWLSASGESLVQKPQAWPQAQARNHASHETHNASRDVGQPVIWTAKHDATNYLQANEVQRDRQHQPVQPMFCIADKKHSEYAASHGKVARRRSKQRIRCIEHNHEGDRSRNDTGKEYRQHMDRRNGARQKIAKGQNENGGNGRRREL